MITRQLSQKPKPAPTRNFVRSLLVLALLAPAVAVAGLIGSAGNAAAQIIPLPPIPESRTIGSHGCASDGTYPGYLKATVRRNVSNEGAQTFVLAVLKPSGQQQHAGSFEVLSGQTRTFTLNGIPDGSYKATLKLNGVQVASTGANRLNFNCERTGAQLGGPACNNSSPGHKGAITATVRQSAINVQSLHIVLRRADGSTLHGGGFTAPSGVKVTFTLNGVPDGGPYRATIETTSGNVLTERSVSFACNTSSNAPDTAQIVRLSCAENGSMTVRIVNNSSSRRYYEVRTNAHGEAGIGFDPGAGIFTLKGIGRGIREVRVFGHNSEVLFSAPLTICR